jgi:hypothetical protein
MGLTRSCNEGSKSIARPTPVSPTAILAKNEALLSAASLPAPPPLFSPQSSRQRQDPPQHPQQHHHIQHPAIPTWPSSHWVRLAATVGIALKIAPPPLFDGASINSILLTLPCFIAIRAIDASPLPLTSYSGPPLQLQILLMPPSPRT